MVSADPFLCGIRGKTGMEAWLYDEDRWPSGTCGGLVTQKKENRMRFISEYDCDEDALSSPDVERIVKRYALLKDEEDKLIDYKEISCKEETPEGYVYVVYAEELMTCAEAYNGFCLSRYDERRGSGGVSLFHA